MAAPKRFTGYEYERAIKKLVSSQSARKIMHKMGEDLLENMKLSAVFTFRNPTGDTEKFLKNGPVRWDPEKPDTLVTYVGLAGTRKGWIGGKYVEWGTRHMPPRPWIRQALNMKRI